MIELNVLRVQKQSFTDVLQNRCFFKNFANFTQKHLCWSLFNKVTGLKACTFIKKRHQHPCFPVKFAKFLRRPFFIEHLRWRLLKDNDKSIRTASGIIWISFMLTLKTSYIFIQCFFQSAMNLNFLAMFYPFSVLHPAVFVPFEPAKTFS